MRERIEGIDIYYEVEGEGLPILALHGWSVDHRIMSVNLEPVFRKHSLPLKRIYPDLPGMGETAGPDWISGSDDMLKVIKGFIEAVIPKGGFLLAGLSYGGYLCRGLLADKTLKSRIKGMLLICPLAVPHEKTPQGLDKGFDMEHRPLVRDEEFLQTLPSEARAGFESIMVVQTSETWKRYEESVLPGIALADYDFLNNKLSRSLPFTFPVEKILFDMPGLVLLGRQDSAVGYTLQLPWIEDFPRSEFMVLDRCGHNIAIEKPEIFRCAVKGWLDRVST